MTVDELIEEGVSLAERGDLTRALPLFEQAAEAGSMVGAINAGRALRTLGRPAEALAQFEVAARAGEPDALVDLGNLLDDEFDDPAGAAGAFEKAAAVGDADGSINLGVLRRREGDLDAAERAFRGAEQRGSALAGAYLGDLLFERGDHARARAAYERSARDRPESLTDYGAALARFGDLSAAEIVLRRAMERDPAAATLLGHVLATDGQVESAERHYRRLLDSPAGPDLRLDLATLLASQRRYSEAVALLRSAIDQGDSRAFANLGATYHEMGDELNAERSYRLGAEAGDDVAQIGLANRLLDRGDREEALSHLEDARAAGNADARRLLEWLGDDRSGLPIAPPDDPA